MKSIFLKLIALERLCGDIMVIGVESELGKGSAFYFDLPLVESGNN